jgi:hypothetical protein
MKSEPKTSVRIVRGRKDTKVLGGSGGGEEERGERTESGGKTRRKKQARVGVASKATGEALQPSL